MNTLKQALKKRGITIKDVAKCGIPEVTVTKHYYGYRQLGVNSVLRYEELVGIPRSELRPDLWPEEESSAARS